jgi:uncharacterized cofD-like protein
MSGPRPSPRIVVIGGGTGTFNLLSRLKYYTQDITVLVSMFDNGGSGGQLRDEYGVLPPGDVRQCLVALSNAPKIRDLFSYRFGEGSFDGHTFGNLFLTAVNKMTDDFGKGIELASQIMALTGRVVPVTFEKAHIIIQDGDQEVVGEHLIEKAKFGHHPKVLLRPSVAANPEALKAIGQADLIVIAPGSLYESLISNLLVGGIREAIQSSSAKVVQVINLVTKPGQTDDWTVADYVDEIERFAGKDTVDYVLYNTQPPTADMLRQYAHDGEYPVAVDEAQFAGKKYEALGGDYIHIHTEKLNPNDRLALERTLIRHDADRISRELMRIYFS